LAAHTGSSQGRFMSSWSQGAQVAPRSTQYNMGCAGLPLPVLNVQNTDRAPRGCRVY